MKHFKINEKQFCELFNSAAADHEIFRSLSQDDSFTWVKTARIDQMITTDVLPTTSVKQFFFPQSEPLFKYEQVGQEVTLKEAPAAVPRIILGVHPCDLGSLRVMETLFKDTYDDELFREKRDKTLLVGMSCAVGDWACFCEQLAINPSFSAAGDLFVTPVGGEEYVLSVTSERGESFLDNYSKDIAPDEKFNPPSEINKEGKYSLDFPKIKMTLDSGFNSPLWEKFARKCITCGICTYLCPTCHCFEIFDETQRGNGSRRRCYDACMFPGFTIMAGGYNPRTHKLARLRQRYMHKYKYFVDNFDLVACSGCGRCIRHCPVNVDVRQNLTAVQNSSAEGSND